MFTNVEYDVNNFLERKCIDVSPLNLLLRRHSVTGTGKCKYCCDALLRRGPDASGSLTTDLQEGWKAHFLGYVLWTQGPNPTPQPIQDDKGNCLLWNGDIFNGHQSENVNSVCDAIRVFNILQEDSLDVPNTLARFCGPYAFVFWNNKTKCLWFGRDVIGRQSLLWKCTIDHLVITSVGHKNLNFDEVPSYGIFMVDFSGKKNIELHFYPWNHLDRSLITYIGETSSVNVVYENSVNHMIIGDGGRSLDWSPRLPLETELPVYKNATDASEFMNRLLYTDEILNRVILFLDILMEAVKIRVTTDPGVCINCTNTAGKCTHSRIGILFSGGLDSTVLALLADKFVPSNQSIDLYNVAFEKPSSSASEFNVPDRKTGEKSLEELKHLSPHRIWNFIKIDVTQRELDDCRDHIIRHLIHPLSSVLDDSLGCALWFASRGEGVLNGTLYKSPARIVLLGMGADEQLGGYMRHRKVFRHGDWLALSSQLRNDLEKIGHRNLGRDNRVVADHGRQPRTPYLDEHVVSYISKLPPWQRCMLTTSMPPGIGDKLILRLSAWHLGLHYAAMLPKRALQFGSRIANSKESGSDHSYRL